MNACPTTAADAGQPHPADSADREATALFWGLQYCRASTLSLTRLELALESRDRQRIIEAMDRLHALDGEIERKVASLPAPEGAEALTEHLGREKMAVAFEKLVLASGISGPGLASSPTSLPQPSPIGVPAPDIDWPPTGEAPEPRLIRIVRAYGAKVAMLLTLAAATGAVIFVAL